MTAVKCVTASLVAVAILTTSATAREVPQAGPYPFAKGHAAARSWSGGPPRMAAPRVVDSEALPRDQPGGVCDHGDNAMIC